MTSPEVSLEARALKGVSVFRGISTKGETHPLLNTMAVVTGDGNINKLNELAANGAVVLSNTRVIIDTEASQAMAGLAASEKLTVKGNKTESLIELPPRKHKGIDYPLMKLSTTDTPLEAPKKRAEHILILGAGVSGLMVAWMLLDKGKRVTIFADDWAWTKDFKKSRMTSQIAGALWEFPPGGCGLTEIEKADKGWARSGRCRATSFTTSSTPRYPTHTKDTEHRLGCDSRTSISSFTVPSFPRMRTTS